MKRGQVCCATSHLSLWISPYLPTLRELGAMAHSDSSSVELVITPLTWRLNEIVLVILCHVFPSTANPGTSWVLQVTHLPDSCWRQVLTKATAACQSILDWSLQKPDQISREIFPEDGRAQRYCCQHASELERVVIWLRFGVGQVKPPNLPIVPFSFFLRAAFQPVLVSWNMQINILVGDEWLLYVKLEIFRD